MDEVCGHHGPSSDKNGWHSERVGIICVPSFFIKLSSYLITIILLLFLISQWFRCVGREGPRGSYKVYRGWGED